MDAGPGARGDGEERQALLPIAGKISGRGRSAACSLPLRDGDAATRVAARLRRAHRTRERIAIRPGRADTSGLHAGRPGARPGRGAARRTARVRASDFDRQDLAIIVLDAFSRGGGDGRRSRCSRLRFDGSFRWTGRLFGVPTRRRTHGDENRDEVRRAHGRIIFDDAGFRAPAREYFVRDCSPLEP